MSTDRPPLPQLDADSFLTDGGLETTLIFHDGFELPDFAAFVLLDDPAGRDALVRYFDSYAKIARRDNVGIILETPTWRASPDWAPRLGYSIDDLERVNREAVVMLEDVRRRHQSPNTPVVISGCLGPRGDGYIAGDRMSPDESSAYHSLQVRAFAAAGADLVTAITMTYSAEAIGIVEAARRVGIPVVVSFTVETDGVLPSGELLGAAIDTVDAATDAYAAYYMINCAHPTHFSSTLDPEQPWARRLRGVRANASRMSHAELDEAESLDSGDPEELAELYHELRTTLPQLTVLGGCCGTDDRHISAISTACVVAGSSDPSQDRPAPTPSSSSTARRGCGARRTREGEASWAEMASPMAAASASGGRARPAPIRTTARALSGCSRSSGRQTIGTPWARATVTDPRPAWVTSRSAWGITAACRT